ncbi:MAG: c-type cytochrome [Burkholderiaceae bacterium]
MRLLAAAAVGMAASIVPVVAMAQDNAKPDLAAGQEIAATVCVACHGTDGNSPTSANPLIAGQHAGYLAKQLRDFKSVDGADPTRPSALMAGFASMLSDEDIRNVSAYFASQALKPVTASEKELVELGQQIYRGGIAAKGVPACAACHGPTGAGIPVQYPRLNGQYAEYTAAELTKFRQGERNNNIEMTAIAERMSDAEIRAVSDYIAGLR